MFVYLGGKEMKSVTCAICKYQGLVKPLHIWEAWGHKYPDVWICDTCKEW